jgi:hypothetical protein
MLVTGACRYRNRGRAVTLAWPVPPVMARVRREAPAHEPYLVRFPDHGVSPGAVSGQRVRVRSRRELARQRRPRGHRCRDHLIAAPLWPQHDANLGTLLRACDAVGAARAWSVQDGVTLRRLG